MSSRKSRGSRTGFSALEIASRIVEKLDTPVALKVYLLIKHQEWDQLATMRVEPIDYVDAQAYFLDAQAVALLRKYPLLDTTFDKDTVGAKKFIQSEEQCRKTNSRLFNRKGNKTPKRVEAVLYRARQKIEKILGPVPTISSLNCRFGPGASLGVRGKTSAYNKVHSTLECTKNMLPILGELLHSTPAWFDYGPVHVNLVEGSELTFVPKDAGTSRPICIEPLLNGYLQKGIGSFLRKRLGLVGVNLRDQSINQRLARLCFSNELSTVDFSSASDTIAWAVILDLLPFEWLDFLEYARCQYFRVGDSPPWYEFSKFSSMGNAYTFELESLIFYAIACACCEYEGIEYECGRNISVYGDDVILPQSIFDFYSEVCSYMGFSVNHEKSFHKGSFFESCGCDYFEEHNVRPFHIKKGLKTLEDYYYVTNEILRLCERISKLPNANTAVINGLRDTHSWCVASIPRRLRHLIPEGVGDGGLVADFDVACPRFTELGYVYKHRISLPIDVEIKDSNMLYAMYHVSDFPVPDFDRFGFLLPKPNKVTDQLGFKLPDKSDPGKSYQVRNYTRSVTATSVLENDWPAAPYLWSKRSISLVNRE